MKPDIGKVMEKSHYGTKKTQLTPSVQCGNEGEKCSSTLMNHTRFDFINSYWPSSDHTGIPVQQHQLSKFYEIYWNIMELLWPITIYSELLKDVKVEGRRQAN